MSESHLIDISKFKKADGSFDHEAFQNSLQANLNESQSDLSKQTQGRLNILEKHLPHVYKLSCDKTRTFISVSEANIATAISPDELHELVFRTIKSKTGETLTAKQTKDLADTFRIACSRVLDKRPPSISTDPTEITFNRISIAPSESPTPTWDSFLARCSNAEALMAYTWSLLVNTDESQQYLLLRGEGQDGKSSYTAFLKILLGDNAYAAIDAKDAHWPAACVGKRLAVCADLNNTAIVLTSNFKQITGRDAVSISQKYEKTYTATLDTKFILTTNQEIAAKFTEAERRRAIICEVTRPTEIIPDYRQRLWAERDGFLYKCREAYVRAYDNNTKSIKCDYTDYDDAAEEFEAPNESVLENNFVLAHGAELTPREMFDALTRAGLKQHEISDFKKYLRSKYKIKPSRKNPSAPRIIRGIRLRTLLDDKQTKKEN